MEDTSAHKTTKIYWDNLKKPQSQKQQNDLCVFPRQAIQYHSNKSMPWPAMLKKLKLNSSMKTYKTS